MANENLESMLYEMKVDLASIKTDVTWLKRLFVTVVVIIGAMFGVDMSGMVG